MFSFDCLKMETERTNIHSFRSHSRSHSKLGTCTSLSHLNTADAPDSKVGHGCLEGPGSSSC